MDPSPCGSGATGITQSSSRFVNTRADYKSPPGDDCRPRSGVGRPLFCGPCISHEPGEREESVAMIQLWSWPTPNGQKLHIALEELELKYRVVPVDIGKGEQLTPEFLALTSGNHRIPAIVDPDGPGGPLTLIESGAILIYLAE